MVENKSDISSTYSAARHWADAGVCLIPVFADGSKQPDWSALPEYFDEVEQRNKRGWKPYQDRLSTPEEHQHWFGNGTAHGIGLVHGKVSGNSEVLDFDEVGLFEQFDSLCREQGYGDILDAMPLIETPSGGRHLGYRCEEPVAGNQKLAQRLVEAAEGTKGARQIGGAWYTVETRIETRGEGGYTLAPGSPAACHPDQKLYRFMRGRPATLPVISAEDRNSLLALAATFNEYIEPSYLVDAPRTKTSPNSNGGLRPGDDYNERGEYESLLEQHGWRRLHSGGDKGLWLRPGKTKRGLSATSNYAGSGLFYVFSSNASPFAPEKAYSPFAVYSLLEHSGDFREAAKKLGEGGFGEPLTAGVKCRTLGESRNGTETRNGTGGSKNGCDYTASLPDADPWPTADAAMFHGLAGEIVRTVEPHTEADSCALLMQFLAAFGSAIGRSAHFAAEADQHFGNLFCVIVGISSKGRKGTSWNHIRRLFALAAPQWESFCLQSGLSSGEGLIWHVRDAVEKPVKNKTTGEVELETIDPGIDDKRLLVMESEFASVLRVAARDGNTLSAVVRDAWDRGRLQTMTKSNAAKATGAHVSLIGHVTVDELRRELSSTEAGNGFANRFLWICARRSKELPEGGSLQEGELFPLAGRLSAAIEAGRGTGLLVRDEEARQLWRAVYHDLSEGGPGLAGAVTSRGEAQVMRLALLYALLDGAEEIQREHLTAALALWEYSEASARYVFGDSLGDPVADDILRALQNAPEGMNRTDLQNLLGRHQSSNRIGQALALLLKYSRARVEQEQTGGRPSERWFAV